jgi:hypothetical protein
MFDKIPFIVSKPIPVLQVRAQVNLLGSPERGLMFFVHLVDVVILDRKKNQP